MAYFVDLILPLPLDNRFTYSLTDDEANFIQNGMRLAVQFGKNRIYTGIVAEVHQNPPEVYEAKPIHQILDEKPLLTSQQLKFWNWLATYYLCTEGEVMRAALPGAFLLESESIVKLRKEVGIESEELNDDEYLVIEALQRQSSMKIQEIEQLLDRKKVLPVINKLVSKSLVDLNQEIFEQFKPKEVRYVRLNPAFEAESEMHALLDELSRAPKQREILMAYFSITARSKKPLKVKDLLKESQASSAVLKSLIDKEIFQEFYQEIDRVVFTGEVNSHEINLNEIQQKAIGQIRDNFKENNVCLLHGVTSSGKTEIYIKLIEEAIEKGKQALYLLPEIA
ncbi:MAG: DEAD/DEAH box helicase family protein, partial [Christiangramia sp.]|nr:DEAD/DEAH box helicase family protein [Christiangramia sp.]